MRLRIRLLTLVLLSSALYAGGTWIFFQEKPTPGSFTRSPELSARFQRLELTPDPWPEFPINPEYLTALTIRGLRIRHVSRWFNAVSVEGLDDDLLPEIQALPWVRGIQPIARVSHPHLETVLQRGPDYGGSDTQLQMLEIPALQADGLDGSGIRIAVFDAGFRLQHEVFNGLDVKATRDFVDGGGNPDGAGEIHGIEVLSVLGGYAPGQLVGPAYNATFLLARTEDDLSESRAEEDNWIAALEWADSLGADIVSSSLVYLEFDDPSDNYQHSDLDGQTTLITQATNLAAERGILVVNSMGSEGPGSTSLWAPADGAHVLAVGAVNRDGLVLSFSGRGPTADGRVKPDLVALGSSVVVATQNSGYSWASGTSFATPLVSGAAALVLQANPTLPPDSIITLLHAAGTNSENPDNETGWGIPKLTRIVSGPSPTGARDLLIYPNPNQGGNLVIRLPAGTGEVRSLRFYLADGRRLGAASSWERHGDELLLPTLPGANPNAGILLVQVISANDTCVGKMLFLP